MAEITDDVRRRIMQANKSKDTKPELDIRRMLHAMGARFRLHRKDLPGKPDIVLPGRKLCIFVNGCFWHQHQGCYLASKPKTNSKYWSEKFKANKLRDKRNEHDLRDMGWRVEVIWECELDNPAKLQNRLEKLL
ncbi:very short patch repair endonuclease [Amphritea sp. HPY]|uniref:very short patch repair endonuclease n=1 Tax=Amphritea sp. HPY TaxID=3421652 RepID=UPI003D7C64C2